MNTKTQTTLIQNSKEENNWFVPFEMDGFRFYCSDSHPHLPEGSFAKRERPAKKPEAAQTTQKSKTQLKILRHPAAQQVTQSSSSVTLNLRYSWMALPERFFMSRIQG